MKKITIELEVWEWMTFKGITEALRDIGLFVSSIKDSEDTTSSENNKTKKES